MPNDTTPPDPENPFAHLSRDEFREIWDDWVQGSELSDQLGGDSWNLQTTLITLEELLIPEYEMPRLCLETIDSDEVQDERIFKVSLAFDNGETIRGSEIEIEADAVLIFTRKQAIKIPKIWPAGILAFVDGLDLLIHSLAEVLTWESEETEEDFIVTATWQIEGEEKPVWIGNFKIPKSILADIRRRK